MYYIKEEEQSFIKYEVIIQKEKLIDLKKEIIEKCSKIVHISRQSFSNLHDDNQLIRNYKCKGTKIKENQCTADQIVYLIEYDEYKPPQLVDLINEILEENPEGIEKLLLENPEKKPQEVTSEEEQEYLQAQQSIIEEVQKSIEKVDIDLLKRKIDSIRKYKQFCELNENQIPESNYYEAVKKCITLREVSRINKSILNKVESFFGSKIKSKNFPMQ